VRQQPPLDEAYGRYISFGTLPSSSVQQQFHDACHIGVAPQLDLQSDDSRLTG
jgi:hypothetical protein